MEPHAIAPATADAAVWSPGSRLLTTALVATVTLVALESLSVATVLPVVSHHLGDLRLYGWVFSAFFLSSLLGTVFAGSIADHAGIRIPVIGGLITFAVGLVIAGSAPNMPVLVAGRLVQGLGAGAVPASAYVAIGRTYAEKARPRMFAVLSTAWVVPGLVSPALAAQVAAHFGWRWVFFGLVPAVAACAALAVPVLSRVPAPGGASGSGALPLAPAIAVAGGAAVFLAGLSAARPLLTIPAVLVGFAVLAPGLRRLTPAGTLRARPGVPAAVLIRGVLTFGFFAGDAYVPLTLTSIRHTSTTYAGVTLTIATLTWTVGAWCQARVVDEAGPRRLVGGGLSIVVVGLAGPAAVLWPAVPLWVAPLGWAVAGFGIGLAYSPISLTALGWAAPGAEGRASASVQLTDLLGTAFGTGAAGAAVAAAVSAGGGRRLGLGLAFALAAAISITGTWLSPRLPSSASRRAAGEL